MYLVVCPLMERQSILLIRELSYLIENVFPYLIPFDEAGIYLSDRGDSFCSLPTTWAQVEKEESFLMSGFRSSSPL